MVGQYKDIIGCVVMKQCWYYDARVKQYLLLGDRLWFTQDEEWLPQGGMVWGE